MDWDWTALGAALRTRRLALHMTQEDLATRADVHAGTIKNYEAGRRSYDKIPQGVFRIAAALEWTPESVQAVLEGGEPTLATAGGTVTVTQGDTDPFKPLADRLPTSVVREMAGREVYAADAYDLTVGGGLRLITVVVRDPDRPGEHADPEQIRREARAWLRVQRKLRDMPPLAWEEGDPEEWRDESGNS